MVRGDGSTTRGSHGDDGDNDAEVDVTPLCETLAVLQETNLPTMTSFSRGADDAKGEAAAFFHSFTLSFSLFMESRKKCVVILSEILCTYKEGVN